MKRATLVFVFGVMLLTVGLAVSPSQDAVPAKKVATIPVDVPSYGLIFLSARVNGSKPMWFALDSGASFPFVIDARRASSLRLNVQNKRTVAGGAGPSSYEIGQTQGLSINIDRLELKNQNAAVIALSSFEAIAGRSLEGLIGSDLFTRYVVEIDYVNETVSLYDPHTYSYLGRGQSVPLTVHDNYLFVQASIETANQITLTGEFLIDTGGGLVTAVLNTPFARANNFPAAGQKSFLDRSLSGLGGEAKLLVTRATSFTLGNFVIAEPLIYVSEDERGALASSSFDGVIGAEILRKFKLIFDAPGRRLILEPNVYYPYSMEYDMSGVRFRAGGEAFRTFTAYQVLENSPAARAGLRKGDVLTGIDGVSASTFTLDQIYQMLKEPGRVYTLSVRRSNRTLSLKVKTERLI
jgi:hypothetical protein